LQPLLESAGPIFGASRLGEDLGLAHFLAFSEVSLQFLVNA
jgi:hypothetical protein